MEDMLADRRANGDWGWVTRKFQSPLYKHGKFRLPNQLKQDVLNSRPVQHIIDELAEEWERPRDELVKEAMSILDQMGHNFNMFSIRVFGLILSKSWKRIYRSIYVNKKSIDAVKSYVPDFPIILLPTHRSYIDFLVISYCFYHYDLPLPIIAGGQDFMSMNIVGTMLRNAGAFFIRRSFGKDKLYWEIFSEYVRTITINGDAPLEFFVEGTRSRTAKSIAPKYGMLTAAVEPFFKADVPDIYIVPVSITYDRTLEEELYAYELLGVPKPKESTRGLLKARKILDNDYGSFHINFGEPISLRSFCGNRIDRSIHNFCRHMSPLTQEEHRVVEDLAHTVVKQQQKNLILPPFVFVATILVNFAQQRHLEIPLVQLLDELRWFINLLNTDEHHKFNPTNEVMMLMNCEAGECVEMLIDICKIHDNILQLTNDTVRIMEIKPHLAPSVYVQYGLSEEMVKRSLNHILLSHYSNQVLHLLVPEGLIALVLKNNPDTNLAAAALYSEYQFLETILKLEFITSSGEASKEDFKKALSFLTAVNAISECEEGVTQTVHCRVNHFLLQLFEPFLIAYNMVCQVLLDNNKLQIPSPAKVIAKAAQAEAERLLLKENIYQGIILSMDILTNAVNSLALMGGLKKEFGNGTSYYIPRYNELLPIAKRLAPYSRWYCGSYMKDESNLWLDSRAKL